MTTTTPHSPAPAPDTIGIVLEAAPGEKRVALDPDTVALLVARGSAVLVEAEAGVEAGFTDDDYALAGARIASRTFVIEGCRVLAVVGAPDPADLDLLSPGQTILGLLDPLSDPDRIARIADRGATAACFELLPRTLSRAQSMDALSSQASAAGYRAALVAATTFGRYLPMMITASGTEKPAAVLVLGTGVAGLQAIATARRLGASVTGYDIRPESRAEVESLGAEFLDVGASAGESSGGYARALTDDEAARQQEEIADHVASFDIVIATAKVPGRRAPVLVSRETVARMRRGSVCIDLAASTGGGNIDGSVDGRTVVTAGGVTVVGRGDLASDLPTSASRFYARNVLAMIDCLSSDGRVRIDASDEVHEAVVVCHDGRITNPAVARAAGIVTT